MIKRLNKSCNHQAQKRFLSVFASVCLFSSPLVASDPSDGTLFSYAEWAEIANNYACDDDFIVLADGKKLCGTIEKLPPIEFTFGRVTFSVDEVAAVSLVNREGKWHVQYITHSGHSYFGPVAHAPFQFWVNEPTDKNPQHVVRKEVAPRLVSFIILKKRPHVHSYTTSSLFTLILKDGQQFPVALGTEPIGLTDGWKEKTLLPHDIVEIWFEGGVHGTIVQGDIRDSLGFVFVKDQYLAIQTPKIAGLVKMPWDRVAFLQSSQNGFKVETPHASGHLVGASIYLPPPVAADEKEAETVAGAHISEPDSLGYLGGKELSEAAGFLAVEPKSIAAAEETDPLREPAALFDSREESDWAMDINFEEPDEEVAELDPADWQGIAEATLFEHLPKVDQEPESFDLKEETGEEKEAEKTLTFDLPKEEKKDEIVPEKQTLTPEALERISEVLAEDDFEYDHSYVHPRVQEFWDDLVAEEDEEDLALLLADVEEEDEELEVLYELAERQEAERGEVDLLLSDAEHDEESERALLDSLLEDY